ncbi:phage repressor protein [Moraxella nonliquefaciens]|uniref:BRO family protein n=1 Tax=Moraxella nonliquefaciens TaxID=478 RepID=UPI0024A6FDAC|nr:BRO family protein [Moraxella nonliquefaciens]MDI4500799.1 phage repressor protein [Moraxella nonliquefaciens]
MTIVPQNPCEMSIFDFKNQPVRVEFKNGEPLFCLTDIASILDLGNANPSRFNLSKDGVHKMYSVDSKGRKNEITFISEPNLYRVIFRSNKKEAVKFQDWVFEEVLPQIRKTGQYQHYALLDQFNKAVLDFEQLEQLASQAGRALSVVGKQLKPKAKNKVITLQAQLQIALPQGE